MKPGDTVEVNVTETDIDTGRRENAYLCPIATATRRALETAGVLPAPNLDLVRVGRHNLHVEDHTVHLADQMEAFVHSFDSGTRRSDIVRPFTFVLTRFEFGLGLFLKAREE